MTQPAVSQALKRLEEQLGTPLIARRGPRFDITEAGEEALRIAEEINSNVSLLSTAMDEHPEQVMGKVRLLSISRIESPAYDDFLIAFHRRPPQGGAGGGSDAQLRHHQLPATEDRQPRPLPVPRAACRRPSSSSCASCASATPSSAAATTASSAATTSTWRISRASTSSRSAATRSAAASRR
ncbi:LysR family transcriptional regulator [Pseudomonas sp. BN102]|uniref:LysR family transcriptional regulator n=1 Tax=Pseudomonas sp. BN102 TaxID=2567886 RepID=UPI002453C38C|nr:LysR family transcriptional regulator [Pseudomonas sp. BN102]